MAKLLSGEFSACLLDYQLGERDGLQLIRDAIAQGCRAPIVFLTGETADRVDIAAMHAGALDYLIKSEITPRLLERALRYALKLGDTLEELRRLATHDQLTGLLNRREFDRTIAEEEERALRSGQSLALVMVDLDRFKSINDNHGHPAGDAVLREVARRLTAEVRAIDRVMRMGGDEFALTLSPTEPATALAIARRICARLGGEPVVIDALKLNVTASIGVALLPEHARTGTALIAAADHALYAAKAAGRNRALAFNHG